MRKILLYAFIYFFFVDIKFLRALVETLRSFLGCVFLAYYRKNQFLIFFFEIMPMHNAKCDFTVLLRVLIKTVNLKVVKIIFKTYSDKA